MLNPRRFRLGLLIIATFVAVYGVVSFLFFREAHYQQVLILIPLYATLALSWNILSGYSGAISFGHAAFFGLGAYSATLLFALFHVTPWLGLPIAFIVGATAGVLIGIPTFRLRGVYFALAMLAYPLVLRYVFEWLGYQEMSLPMMRDNPLFYMQFSDPRWYVLGSLCLVSLALVISLAIENSRFGLSLFAIRQNEFAAEAAGISIFRSKLYAIALSGGLAGLAGAYHSIVLLVTTPESAFGLMQSAQAMVVTLFGGSGTLWGPLIGAAILVPTNEFLQASLGDRFPGIQGIVYGAAIICVITLAPEGIYWRIRDVLMRGRRRGSAAIPKLEEGPSTAAMSSKERSSHGTILRVEGLGKSFGGLKALDRVSFSVEQGAILGIIGQNGSGKTTLFNLINGFIPADSGSVYLQGKSTSGYRPNTLCARGLGRTFQVARPFMRMTVLENVIVGAFVTHHGSSAATRSSLDAIRRVGLLSKVDAVAASLNNLELRLMELARALASQPAIVLLDETLAGLGHQDVEAMVGVIQRLPDDGTTVVIIEHTMHAMMRLANRLIVLDHGKVIADGEPQAIIANREVIRAYLGEKWMAQVAAN